MTGWDLVFRLLSETPGVAALLLGILIVLTWYASSLHWTLQHLKENAITKKDLQLAIQQHGNQMWEQLKKEFVTRLEWKATKN